MASIAKRPDGRWRARYRGPDGKEHAKHFDRKKDAQDWLDVETTKLVTGGWVAPRTAKMTVDAWCDTWLKGYSVHKDSTVRAARVHIGQIKKQFGPRRLDSIRPSEVRAWAAALEADGYAKSYIYALHSRFAQIMDDAVHDGMLAKSPVSKRTSPPMAKPRAYVATTKQVWALHDKVGERWRPAILLGAFAGLRAAEVCGLRVTDVDYMRGIVNPRVQYPDKPLKTETSRTPIPIGNTMALKLSAHLGEHPSDWVVPDELGGQSGPWQLDRILRDVRDQVEGLPEGFRFHDLRHYYASMLIAAGLDVKVVQTRLRHASAKTTLDTYGHLWPDSDDTTRAAIEKVMAARVERSADFLRTRGS